MSQVKCPHCGEVFTIDETNYNSIVKQIRDHEFAEEIKQREKALKDTLNAQLQLERNKAESNLKQELDVKDHAYQKLWHEKELQQSEFDAKLAQALSEKNTEYEKQKSKDSESIAKLQSEVQILRDQISRAEQDRKNAVNQMKMETESEAAEKMTSYKTEIASLKGKLETAAAESTARLQAKESEKQLAVQKAIAELKEEKDREINDYRVKIDTLRNEAINREESLKASFKETLDARDKEIQNQKELVEQYKDFKVRQSTKMIGESLEQHCSYEFNRYRMGMFQNAYFEKDNDARSGSKGDFIFKDYEDASRDNEIISIMFEMKNEADTTATKHKNEDFFKELDKDRNEKGCEYAILVSMLELDNDLYNEGIVDVSFRYPKMYVIRPQFFIPIITILRNAALNSADYKRQLMIERSNNLDIMHFEDNMNEFKDKFGRNYELASRKFNDAIADIDKTIKALEKTKQDLLSSENNLRLANNKAQELTIKRLTKNAPSLRAKFEEIKNNE